MPQGGEGEKKKGGGGVKGLNTYTTSKGEWEVV